MTKTLTNIITDRTEMAQALNFGKYKVLQLDLDTNKGSRAGTTYASRNHGEMRATGELRSGYEKKNDGILYISNDSTMLSATYSVDDFILDAEKANAPKIYKGDEVAVLCYSKKNDIAFVRLVVAVGIDPHCSVLMMLKDVQ